MMRFLSGVNEPLVSESIHKCDLGRTNPTSVRGEKVQVGEFRKITRFDPLLYGKD